MLYLYDLTIFGLIFFQEIELHNSLFVQLQYQVDDRRSSRNIRSEDGPNFSSLPESKKQNEGK